jgi:hypothetical protein
LFASEYPVLAIWEANVGSAEEPAIIDLAQGGDRLLLIRTARGLEMRRQSDGAYAFLEQITHGAVLRRGDRGRDDARCELRCNRVFATLRDRSRDRRLFDAIDSLIRQVGPMSSLDRALGARPLGRARARSSAASRRARRALVRQLAIFEVRLDQAQFLGQHDLSVRERIPHAACFRRMSQRLPVPSANCSFRRLLVLGIVSRLGAIGLFAVNAMAVISYANVLLAEGFEAALAQHVLWGSILVYLMVYGPGKLSLDYLLTRPAQGATA